jgi:hypothetical protein
MNHRVIKLLGEPVQNEDHACDEAILPGQLVERNTDGTVGLQSTAGVTTKIPLLIALEREEMGQGVDGAYAIGDKVKVGDFPPGTRFSGYIASGQNLAKGQRVEANGTGGFRALASGFPLATCLETTGAITTATRVAFEAL